MRKCAFAAQVFLLFIAMHLSAQQQADFDKTQIKVQKVAGSVYMLQGMGGNIGASVGEDGIVVIDDEFLPLADKIEAALKGITDKPVKFVINTHWHVTTPAAIRTSARRLVSLRRRTYASASPQAAKAASARRRRWPKPAFLSSLLKRTSRST